MFKVILILLLTQSALGVFEHLNDTTSLWSLSIRGSHDSAAYLFDCQNALAACAPDPHLNLAMTQTYNIVEQLNNGIRVFDIRVGKGYYLYHGSQRTVTSLYEFNDNINLFLFSNSKEFVIANFQAEFETPNDWSDVVNSYGWAEISSTQKIQLNQIRGRKLRLNKNECSIQDDYNVGFGYSNKISKIINKINEQTNIHENQCFLNYVSGAGIFPWEPTFPIGIAENVDPSARGVIANRGFDLPVGITMSDFIERWDQTRFDRLNYKFSKTKEFKFSLQKDCPYNDLKSRPMNYVELFQEIVTLPYSVFDYAVFRKDQSRFYWKSVCNDLSNSNDALTILPSSSSLGGSKITMTYGKDCPGNDIGQPVSVDLWGLFSFLNSNIGLYAFRVDQMKVYKKSVCTNYVYNEFAVILKI